MYQTRVLEQQELIDRLVSEIAQSVFRKHPELLENYGEKGRTQTMSDLHKHFHYLQTAFRLQAPEIFIDHIKWLFNVLISRNVDIHFVLTGLSLMKERTGELPSEKESFYWNCLSEAIQWLNERRPS
ncbi:hypothetical protein [Bacillus sp. SG-1]|uniref:hypothetical protein n=1 Tax=Bacillus sp. SG-1 TaxID=161544 RepID=UPI0001544A3E|nr:hypothetical protein [Bacillus sp. SG-1]EDL62738.1 hypothetical protein BSG1_18870 [Bacillus sp. SG-1]